MFGPPRHLVQELNAGTVFGDTKASENTSSNLQCVK